MSKQNGLSQLLSSYCSDDSSDEDEVLEENQHNTVQCARSKTNQRKQNGGNDKENNRYTAKRASILICGLFNK